MDTREKLIVEGIREMERYGLKSFSVRRVAAACGVSCAAPYRHFQDKHAYVMAMIGYINEQWYARKSIAAARREGDLRGQIVEISMEYVRFLTENPQFRSIIMLRDDSMTAEEKRLQREISKGTNEIIDAYCKSVHMPPDVRARKTFVVRSLIYGSALMLDSGALEDSPDTHEIIRACIEREFILD
ncbi:MAG: TetR/AcrR family transcriptional regulator [Christensenellales bacterium]